MSKARFVNHCRWGHCACCDCEIMTVREVPSSKHLGKMKKLWIKLPTYCEMTFKLYSGSMMSVAFCTYCRHEFRVCDNGRVFEGVLRGWDKECEILLRKRTWTPTQAQNYMLAMSLDGIECRSS